MENEAKVTSGWAPISQLLLKSFEERQQEFERIKDENEFLEALFDETYDAYSEKFLRNIGKIIKQKIFVEKVKIAYIISNLRNRVEFEAHVRERETKCNFDLKFGTTTGVIVEHFDFEEINSEFDLFNYVRYGPTPLDSIYSICNSLKKLNVAYEDSIFIDVGSGMGRNLLVASEYSFKEIIGIELSKELHKIAERNIKSYKNSNQKCSNIKSVCINALDFKLPNCDSLIIYFYHPFSELVFAEFFGKILDSIVREQQKITLIFLQVVYNTVEKSDLFRLKDSFQLEGEKLSIYSNY